MPSPISHPGVVVAVKKGTVNVQIQSHSACASCQAHARCGFAESKTKSLDVPDRHWERYTPGQQVNVLIDTSRGLQATLIAYVIPSLLLLALIIGLSLAGLPEAAVILVSLAALAAYTLVLFLLRRRIDNRFTLKITEQAAPQC